MHPLLKSFLDFEPVNRELLDAVSYKLIDADQGDFCIQSSAFTLKHHFNLQQQLETSFPELSPYWIECLDFGPRSFDIYFSFENEYFLIAFEHEKKRFLLYKWMAYDQCWREMYDFAEKFGHSVLPFYLKIIDLISSLPQFRLPLLTGQYQSRHVLKEILQKKAK